MTKVRFGVATRNLLRGLGRVQPIASVIGFQEARRGTAAKVRAMGYRVHAPTGPAGRNPIAWDPRRWQRIADGSSVTTEPKRRVSPARAVVWVLLRHRGSGLVVLVVNHHAPNAAWPKPARRRFVRHLEWRRTMWERHMEAVRAAATLPHEGLPMMPDVVVVTGDGNRHRWWRLPGFTHAFIGGPRGAAYDQIHVRGGSIAGARRGARAGSDHAPIVAQIEVPRPDPAEDDDAEADPTDPEAA